MTEKTAAADPPEPSPSEGLGAPVRPGDVVAERYLVKQSLGAGGMGVVMLAHDQTLARDVALKFITPALASSKVAVERFMREARSIARLTNEHAVSVLDVRTIDDGTPVIVMEYLEGEDLRALIDREGPLPVVLAVDYVLQALEAIAEGHAKGVVHRDIKPHNLFLTRRVDGSELIKVLDFGVAKILDAGRPNTSATADTQGGAIGSPPYMSPEQLAASDRIDARTDIWALGVTLYEMLTATLPFRSSSYEGLIAAIASAEAEPLREHRAEIPADLAAVVSACLDKRREQRVGSAALLAEKLAPFGSEDARSSLKRIQRMATALKTAERPGVFAEGDMLAATDPILASSSTSDRRSSAPGSLRRTAPGLLVLGLAAAGFVMLARSAEEERVPPASRIESKPTAPVVIRPAAVEPTATGTTELVEAPSASAVAIPSTSAPTAALGPAPRARTAQPSLASVKTKVLEPTLGRPALPAQPLGAQEADTTRLDVEAEIRKGR